MTPSDFIRKWEKSELKESAAAQSHFLDLCHLLEVETPTDADAVGDTYCFEKGATKSTGGNGFADVWKKGCFGWEYKGPKANLDAAYAQLQRYAVALENPPLLVVSDTRTIVVRTNWTNSVSEVHTISLTDLLHAEKRELLKNCFVNPEVLKPKRTRDDLTKEAADEFSALAQRLRDQGHEAETVAHFVNRLVFCMFAEDVGLLPNKMFERAIEHARKEPEKAQDFLRVLFAAMKSGGPVGFETVPWFNGGLFDNDEALPLGRDEIELVYRAAKLFWADIDPSILGTLFERGLDPSKRSQLGAHYTDRDKIMMIIRPVIVEPLEAEWIEAKATIAEEMEKSRSAKSEGARTQAYNRAAKEHSMFIERLSRFRVLDPACGSGNFLYLSLKALKDIEHRANVEAEALGLPRGFPRVGPEAVKGIEINPYAAELARVSIWVGEIQWMRANGFDADRNPILKPLGNIECRDAVLNGDGTRAVWPEADVVVGNPPFLGNKKMIRELGETYTRSLRNTYSEHLPGAPDFVAYWFENCRRAMSHGLQRFGLVATNSIRSSTNRGVIRGIIKDATLTHAWSDEPWVNEGASVRVSMIVASKRKQKAQRFLDGVEVTEIPPNLGRVIVRVDELKRLPTNSGTAFVGVILNGDFELDRDQFLEMVTAPVNVNGRPNTDVIRSILNGDNFNGRRPERHVIDFGSSMPIEEAAYFEKPFEHISKVVKPYRQRLKEDGSFEVRAKSEREKWWRYARPRPNMRKAMSSLKSYIATPMVSSTRTFDVLPVDILPDQKLVAFNRNDFVFLGIVQSIFHELWTLETCEWIGSGNDVTYAKDIVFETFPFPDGLSPNQAAVDYESHPLAGPIGKSASRLVELRNNWLNPPELVNRIPEVVSGFPDRILPVNAEAGEILKHRTLTNLYNERPTWLEHAHKALDETVAVAYGWGDDWRAGKFGNDEILARLFQLNQVRAAKQATSKRADKQ